MPKTTSKIEFLEDIHVYMLDGIILPSVSAIIKDDTYKAIPPHILEFAAQRGTAVHLATEMIDKGLKPKLEPYYAEYVVQYMLYKQEHSPTWDEMEMIVHTDEYAGTLDRIAYYSPSEIRIVDIKTTSKLYKDKIALQLGAYAYAHSQMHEVDISLYKGGVIWLRKDSWKYVEIEPNVDGFLEKLKEYKEREECEEWI